MRMKFLTAVISLSTIINIWAQNGKEHFEKCFDALKEAKTLSIVGEFRGYGKNKGKVIETIGEINLVKDGLKILKYKSVAESHVALLDKKYNDRDLYDGTNVYIYDENNKLLNKGAWDSSGKKYLGYSRILYINLIKNFEIFDENKLSVTKIDSKNGYILSLSNTANSGEIQLHFNFENPLPYKIIRYNEKNNKDDYVELKLSEIKSNILFSKDFFTLESFNTENKIIKKANPNKSVSQEKSNTSLLSINSLAPQWELINQDGIKKKLSDYKGRVVVLDFWATWCAPCVQAQPKLQSIHKKYKDVVVLGMNFNDKKNINLKEYRVKKNLSYEMMLNTEKIAKLYKVISLPTAYVIDKSGKIIFSSIGYSENKEKELVRAVENALE